MNSETIKTVLFDLDGTLADTAPDLVNALNHVRKIHGKKILTFEQVRPIVSHGTAALIQYGFELSPNDNAYEKISAKLLDYYRNNIATETRLFPGMEEVLETIEASGRNWGVVTNKPSWLTEPLMEALQLNERAACIISGDTLSTHKPDPAPMHFASKVARSSSQDCLYIGDAERDIEAGRRAGMKTLAALFGYIGKNDDPTNWGADGLIASPSEILKWITIPS